MFDVGFSEIVLIAVVALVVIGPEKLPKAARTLGHLFGRLQRYVNDVKADINREIELDELRKLQQQVRTAASDLQTSMNSAMQQVQTGVRAVESDLNAGAAPASASTSAALPANEMQPLTPPAGEASGVPAPAPLAAAVEAAPAPDAAAATESPRQASLPGLDRG